MYVVLERSHVHPSHWEYSALNGNNTTCSGISSESAQHNDLRYKPNSEVIQVQVTSSWQSILFPSFTPTESRAAPCQWLRFITMSTDFSKVREWAGLQEGHDFPPCTITGDFNRNVGLLSFGSSFVLLKSSYYILAWIRGFVRRSRQHENKVPPWYAGHGLHYIARIRRAL